MKNVENRISRPISAESDARLPISGVMCRRTLVNSMLKKREPRFVPETMPEQQRRIDHRCQNRRGNGLRPIVIFDKFIDTDFQVNLKTRVAEFYKSVFQMKTQFVQAFDMNETFAAV